MPAIRLVPCEYCGEEFATTVHHATTTDGVHREVHVCFECANEIEDVPEPDPHQLMRLDDDGNPNVSEDE